MASIDFTDSTGAATLESPMPSPGDRFANWTPFPVPVADRKWGLGNAQPHQFAYRTDYRASFEIRNLDAEDMPVVDRLIRHLSDGGQVTVNTDDVNAAVYTCYLAEDTVPELSFADADLIEYTLALVLTNTAAQPMLCQYRGEAAS